MADDPVKRNATNFVTATPTLAASAARVAFVDPSSLMPPPGDLVAEVCLYPSDGG
jgi:hypothetical protein